MIIGFPKPKKKIFSGENYTETVSRHNQNISKDVKCLSASFILFQSPAGGCTFINLTAECSIA